jgi:hypothetical protein
VAVAVENLRHQRRKKAPDEVGGLSQQGRDLRPLYAFGFGLIHGFGFAGALTDVGLPRAALGVALASFNIGVEAGQAAIVLLAAPVLAWTAKRQTRISAVLLPVGSLIIGLLGAYWFVARLTAR